MRIWPLLSALPRSLLDVIGDGLSRWRQFQLAEELCMADRVAVVAFCWFVLWTGVGVAVGSVVGEPRTGAVNGFFFALLALSAWPWIMPESIENWMDDYCA